MVQNYHEPLDGILFISAMVILGITLGGLSTMVAVRETSSVSRLLITQRRRYGWTLVGQIAAAAAVLWPILQFGVNDTFEVLDAWMQVPVIGWIVFGVYWMGIVSPVLTLMTVISIYRHPAKAARKVRGGYILTEHARQGIWTRPVQAVVAPGMAGSLKRYWFDTGPSSNVADNSGGTLESSLDDDMQVVSIAGLDKADVLAALYNNAKMQGLGISHAEGSMAMSREQAAHHLAGPGTWIGEPKGCFDYLNGRVMKVDLTGEAFDPRLYDRDNGDGKAARVVANLRATGSVEEII